MNRTTRFAGAISLYLVGLCAACTSSGPSSTFGPAGERAHVPDGKPALAALQTRDRIVHLYGDHGALFVSVRDDAGNVVAEGLPLDELRRVDPFLYEACTSAVAKSGTYLDARLYVDDVHAPAGK